MPFLRRLTPEKRILFTVFGAPYVTPDYFARYRSIYRLAVDESDAVLSSSHYCAGAVRQLSDKAEVDVVYFGVDLERFNPDLERNLFAQHSELRDKLVILFLARMESEMGIMDALAIAKGVNEIREDTAFVIAGARGSATEAVQQAADKSGGRILCHVNVPGDELPHYYASADIVMAPTVGRWACMGLTIKEALATGRPVVVTDSGGIPEAVDDGVEGAVVPLTEADEVDEAGFIAAILDLAEHADLREKMGRKARERAETMFSVELTNSKSLKLFLGRIG